MYVVRKFFAKTNLALLTIWLSISDAVAQAGGAAGAGGTLDTLAQGIEDNLLGGRWRVVFVAVMIMAVGFMFAAGRLAWYWALAIMIGVLLIAGSVDIANWLFGMFGG